MGLFDGKPIEAEEIPKPQDESELCADCIAGDHGICAAYECGCRSCHGPNHEFNAHDMPIEDEGQGT